MTKEDVLAKVREIRPNEYTDEWALSQLEELEQRVLRELMDGYLIPEAGEGLLVVSPYDGIYADWIVAQIDLANGDYDRYNNQMQLFNTRWEELGRHISRTYRREKPSVYRL